MARRRDRIEATIKAREILDEAEQVQEERRSSIDRAGEERRHLEQRDEPGEAVVVEQRDNSRGSVQHIGHEVDTSARRRRVAFIFQTGVALREDVGEGAVQSEVV